MGKQKTEDDEAKARQDRQRRARERFGSRKDDDKPEEGTDPEGDFGPSSELSRRRLRRDIQESEEGE